LKNIEKVHLSTGKSQRKNRILLIGMVLAFTSCTYSINLIHSEGRAEKMIDENQAASPDIKTDLDIPKKLF
jgi:hypothetical protein